MRTYLVGYDLNRPRGASDYPELYKALQAYPNWWHHLDSTWIIKTDWSSVQIRDDLRQHIDSGDKLLVVRLEGTGAWFGFNEKGSQWLKNNLSYQ
jgi:hypothetical protein